MGNRAGVAFPTRRGSDISCGYCTVSEELACTLPVSRLMLHAPFFFQTQGCRIVIACSRRFRALAAAHPSLLHETRVILCTRLQAMLEMSENIGRSERKPKPICIASLSLSCDEKPAFSLVLLRYTRIPTTKSPVSGAISVRICPVPLGATGRDIAAVWPVLCSMHQTAAPPTSHADAASTKGPTAVYA